MLSQVEYGRSLRGYEIIDCAVRSPVSFHFLGRNVLEGERAGVMSEWKVTKRCVSFYLDEPEGGRLGSVNINNFNFTVIGANKLSTSANEVLCIDSNRSVYSQGGGRKGVEDSIPKATSGPMRGIANRVRMVGGVLYVVGSHRSICCRMGVNEWKSLCYDLPVPTIKEHDDEKKMDDMSFIDIDAFSADDLYVVAGRGVVWHLKDKKWKHVPFPSNMYLESICCAGDGYVYIGAQSGTVFKGREDQWEMISRGELTLPFKDIVWHADRLWCCNDYGLWTLEGGDIIRVDNIPSEIAVCAGNLSAADGMMLMAGRNGAAYHDGQEWHLIFNQAAMESKITGRESI